MANSTSFKIDWQLINWNVKLTIISHGLLVFKTGEDLYNYKHWLATHPSCEIAIS